MIDVKNVIKVGKERIKYKNKQGNEAYIELASCANTWAYRHADVNLEDGSLRCVGDCVNNGKEAYIEFYNIGHVKLGVGQTLIQKIFSKPLTDAQIERLESFKKTLESNGYTVYNIE